MERLIKLSEKKISSVQTNFKRFLYDTIEWSQQLIIILGHRGAGKTTLLLQRAKKEKDKTIYISLDDIYFESYRLVNLIDSLYEKSYRVFYIDEVHRYQYWSKDLKNLYDNYPDIKLIATASSILKLNEGQSDLSRRAITYYLPGLSFREYLNLEHKVDFEVLKLNKIINEHHNIADSYFDIIEIDKEFRKYLKYAYYPFYKEGINTYAQKLKETINIVLDIDIATYEDISHSTVRNMKKLLYIISQTVPFTPNISKLSEQIGIPRNSILKILDLLSSAKIISLLKRDTKGISYLQKPEKIYLQNTNIAYLLSENMPNIGNLRETFFLNQIEIYHNVTSSRYSDFLIDNTYTFEIGGPSKTGKQIQGVPSSFIVSDGIKSGSKNKIPLWLFGFLY